MLPLDQLLNGFGIDLHSQDPMNVIVNYDGTHLAWTIQDTTTQVMSPTFSADLDIPSRVGTTAQVGFSGSTGASTSVQYVETLQGSFSTATVAAFSGVPMLISLSPLSAAAGSSDLTVTANGANFTPSSIVQFNGTSLATTFVSGNQLTAVIPASLLAQVGTASVTVFTPGIGSSAAQMFTIAQVNANSPTLSSISPSSAPAGSSDLPLAVFGSNFAPNSIVQWNGISLATTFLTSSQLTALVPANLLAQAGTASVTVSTPNVGSSLALPFTVAQAFLSGTAVTFTAFPGVSFTGPVASFSVANSNALPSQFAATINWGNGTTSAGVITALGNGQFLVSGTNTYAQSGTYPVTVTVLSQSGASIAISSTAVVGTVPGLPTLISLSPLSAAAGSSDLTVTANGANFTPSSIVQFNGTSLATTFVSGNQLTAVIPASLLAQAGTASVTVFTPGIGSSAAQMFTIAQVNASSPTLSSTSPSSASVGSNGVTLAVFGSNFMPNSIVQWNGISLATTFLTSSQLTALVPANLLAQAGTASVTVSTPNVGSSLALPFTVAQAFLSGTAVTFTAFPGVSFTGPVASFSVANSNALPSQFAATINWGNGTTSAGVITALGNGQFLVSGTNTYAQSGTYPVTVTVLSQSGASITISSTAVVGTVPGLPTLISLSPLSAAAGSSDLTVTVNGANFTPSSIVQFNGTSLATTFVSGNQLTAVVPASLLAQAGTASVTVFTPGIGSSAAQMFTIAQVNASSPTLSSISPSSASVGSNGVTLAVFGSNFAPNSIVQWNGISLATTFLTSSQLTALVPANLLAQAGTASVTVSTPNVGSSLALPFTVAQAFLSGTGVTFTASPGVSFTGPVANFSVANSNALPSQFAATINWGNGTTSAGTITAVGNGQFLVSGTNTYAQSGTYPVTVTVLSQSGASITISSTAVVGTVPGLPTLISLSPLSAAAGSSDLTVTVNGANFTPGSTVQWNGTSLATTFVSSSQLTAVIPASLLAQAGTASVTVSTPGIGSSSAQTFTVSPSTSSPTLTSLSPSSAMAGSSDLTLIVNGTNFVHHSIVQWNGTSLATTFVSSSQLSAVVPASLLAQAGTASVLVSVPGLGNTMALTFTIAGHASRLAPGNGGTGPLKEENALLITTVQASAGQEHHSSAMTASPAQP